MIDETLREAEEKMDKAVEVAKEDFGAIRTGRASAAMFNKIVVDYYGAPTPLQQLASFATPEARTVIITPYDRSAMAGIEKALRDSDLGVNPSHDGAIVRLILPLGTFLVVVRLLVAAVRIFLFVALAFFFFAVGFLISEFELTQHIARKLAEARLVLDEIFHFGESLAGTFFDPITPNIDQCLRVLRWRLAGQTLAHHERQRFFERRFGFLGDMGKAAMAVLILDLGGQVVGHAGHAIGAERFDAGTFDTLEHGARGA